MIEIPYHSMVIFISVLWILTRIFCFLHYKGFSPTRELQLLLVYICIIVVVRFTFCPFGKVDGKILPLLFDAANVFPFRLNLIPLVNLTDYEILQLPFFDRVTDIDDLILNSLRFAAGYLIWLFVKFMKQKIQGA